MVRSTIRAGTSPAPTIITPAPLSSPAPPPEARPLYFCFAAVGLLRVCRSAHPILTVAGLSLAIRSVAQGLANFFQLRRVRLYRRRGVERVMRVVPAAKLRPCFRLSPSRRRVGWPRDTIGRQPLQ